MSAYYNEIDPFAAAWLRELIRAGAIAPGDVDERDIRDVRPDDLKAYTQCHFFAGIGVWSYALRQAGWPDDKPVWTGSCPCQPFSAAGKRAGQTDERHLWPHWHHLIRECRPAIVLGEQVASKDGLGWLDLVSADLEGEGYAFGASDLCAAGVGAPHIRQRLWFVGMADADDAGSQGRRQPERERADERAAGESGLAGRLADPDVAGERVVRGGDHSLDARKSRDAWSGLGRGCGNGGTSPINGFRRDADWLYCRDGKWRPVEPALEQMVNGLACVMVYLRDEGGREEAKEVIHATAANPYAREMLRAMRDTDAPEAVWLASGGQIGFYAATLLLAFVLEHEGQLGHVTHGSATGGAEARKALLRALREIGAAACASQGPRCAEQRLGELGDALSKLSQAGALKGLSTLNGSPLAAGATARVGRLRGYGNAINAAAAQTFIKGVMDVRKTSVDTRAGGC